MLKLSRSPVVVAFDKVDCSAGQPLSIGDYAFRTSEAEIPEEIKNIVWLGASVDTLADHIVHLLTNSQTGRLQYRIMLKWPK